jgi:hypothetical protein
VCSSDLAAPIPPTVEQIRAEMDSNSTQLDAIRDDIATIPAAPTPPTVEQIRAEMDSNSTQLDAIRDDIAAIPAAPTPPTVEQIRAEMDSNSTQLTSIVTTLGGPVTGLVGVVVDMHNDVTSIDNVVNTIQSDVEALAIPTPPTVEQIRAELDSNSTQLDAIRDDIAALPAPLPGPTAEEIRVEMDDHSEKLAEILENVWNARTVTWDYRGNDFRCMDGITPVVAAVVAAFRAEDYAAGKTGPEYILSQVESDADGKWIGSMTLDTGLYVLLMEKAGVWGPVTMNLTVV